MNTHRLHAENDKGKQQHAVVDHAFGTFDVKDESFPEHEIHDTDTYFLDTRFRLLDLLTPTATQNRLSYLVELMLDKSKKRISNEAIKVRLRKDSLTFGAQDMPTDVRGIGKFVGARSVSDVTRHRCGGNDCSYAWIGAVEERDYDRNEVCPECGHPRYIIDRGSSSRNVCFITSEQVLSLRLCTYTLFSYRNGNKTWTLLLMDIGVFLIP